MKKKVLAAVLAAAMVLGTAGCSGGNGGQVSDDSRNSDDSRTEDNSGDDGADAEETEIQVFIAASLNTVMTELAETYNEDHPEVKITYNADSSGNSAHPDRRGV